MTKNRHVLGISGGKDSAALAIYLHQKYPQLPITYYTCDTGKELDETYQLIENLESYLGQKIKPLRAVSDSHVEPFDHFLQLYGNYLPSATSRWCTQRLKLEPFEQFVGNDPVVSYVGIRGDEEREGYISKKRNIQSIFPFRKNIWSEDVIMLVLANGVMPLVCDMAAQSDLGKHKNRLMNILEQATSPSFNQNAKLHLLLDTDTVAFNHLVYEYLRTTSYPLASEADFPLLYNDEVLVRADIFRILEESGVGVPAYYNKKTYTVQGNSGEYARSRSGCYFCFFQQKIEWVWLYEQHPDMYNKAMQYEKDGYQWMQNESLADLIKPERIAQIKTDHIKRTQATEQKQTSPFLTDILDDEEEIGCAACFI
jgi:hypothetical protein